MWVAKLKFPSEKTLIGSKAKLYEIDLFGFPLSFSYEKEWIIVHITGTIFGKEKNIKEFLKDLKKEKRVINFEINNDFFVGTIREPLFAKAVYNKEIIHIAPALISCKSYEIITIGAFDRKILINATKVIEKKYNGEMISIEEKRVKSISIVKIKPELTSKQKEAIKLAIRNGYYHSPRKIDVKHLAKLSRLSFSTYQVHLRKAEEKIIPYFFE